MSTHEGFGYYYLGIWEALPIEPRAESPNLLFALRRIVGKNTNALRGMRIMIVDDHAAMRRVVMNVVSLSRIEPLDFIECESGEDAVHQYADLHPDCVLMDVQLPKMSGFQATEHIRTHDATAKVVIVTSFDTPSVRLKAEKLHVDGFVSKDHLTDLHSYLHSIHQDPSIP